MDTKLYVVVTINHSEDIPIETMQRELGAAVARGVLTANTSLPLDAMQFTHFGVYQTVEELEESQ